MTNSGQTPLTREEQRWHNWFKRFSDSSPVTWMNREAFYTILDNRYLAGYRARMVPVELEVEMSLEDIRSRTTESPVHTPPDEDFAGPVERWYGAVGDQLFTLDYHYALAATGMMYLACEDKPEVCSAIVKALEEFRQLH